MHTLAIFQFGGWEILVLAVLGLLIFGRRLPEVGKSLGKGIVEFKKGLQGIEDEIDHASSKPSEPPRQFDEPAQTIDTGASDDPVAHAADESEAEAARHQEHANP